MSKIMQIGAYFEKFTSMKTGSLKMEFSTQENVAPEILAWLLTSKNKLGYLFFSQTQIEAVDMTKLPKIDRTLYDGAKTPSQRLRSVLYVLHEQAEHGKGNMDEAKIKAKFQDFYNEKMEQMIAWIKNKLD
jgi:hypothetical protein